MPYGDDIYSVQETYTDVLLRRAAEERAAAAAAAAAAPAPTVRPTIRTTKVVYRPPAAAILSIAPTAGAGADDSVYEDTLYSEVYEEELIATAAPATEAEAQTAFEAGFVAAEAAAEETKKAGQKLMGMGPLVTGAAALAALAVVGFGIYWAVK